MSKSLVTIQIRSLEEQLKVMKAKLEQEEPKEVFYLGDMLGLFEGQLDLPFDEIKSYEYKIDQDFTP